MRRYTILITIATLVCALLLAGVVAAQSGGQPPPAQYVVAKGTASGGHYRLAGTAWQASGVASGGGYRLAGPASPTGTGTPCCCNYLPCVLRSP